MQPRMRWAASGDCEVKIAVRGLHAVAFAGAANYNECSWSERGGRWVRAAGSCPEATKEGVSAGGSLVNAKGEGTWLGFLRSC